MKILHIDKGALQSQPRSFGANGVSGASNMAPWKLRQRHGVVPIRENATPAHNPRIQRIEHGPYYIDDDGYATRNVEVIDMVARRYTAPEEDAVFRLVCSYWWCDGAIKVMAEDPATDFHTERVQLAGRILSGQQDITPLARAVATNVTIAGLLDAEDMSYLADMEYAIGSLFTAVARATATT